MNLPGFNSEDLLYRASGQYRSSQSPAAPVGENRAVMQAKRRGYRCFTDNVPGHPGARILCCENLDTGEQICEIIGGAV